MATKVKPCRIQATGTPQVGYVPKYVDEDTFQWGTGGGGSDIVYATQAEYNALLPGAASDGKHYFIYSTDGGGGWQPGANTIAYYPLDTDFNDASGNSRNLTNTNATITTLNGVTCAYYNGSSYSTYTGATLPRTARTMSVWANGTAINDGVIVDIKKYNQDNTGALATIFYGNSVLVADLSSIDMGLPCQTNTWYYVVATQEGNTVKIYINGNLEGTESNRPDYSTRTPDGWALGSHFNSWHNGALNGYLSNVILEDKVRTAQEIQDYYNQTKANYGIS